MKDLDGKEINVGDTVAVSVGGRYHDFYIGTVFRLTTKMICVRTERGGGGKERTIRPESCIILGDKIVTAQLAIAVEGLERISIKTTCDLTQVVADLTLAKIKDEEAGDER